MHRCYARPGPMRTLWRPMLHDLKSLRQGSRPARDLARSCGRTKCCFLQTFEIFIWITFLLFSRISRRRDCWPINRGDAHDHPVSELRVFGQDTQICADSSASCSLLEMSASVRAHFALSCRFAGDRAGLLVRRSVRAGWPWYGGDPGSSSYELQAITDDLATSVEDVDGENPWGDEDDEPELNSAESFPKMAEPPDEPWGVTHLPHLRLLPRLSRGLAESLVLAYAPSLGEFFSWSGPQPSSAGVSFSWRPLGSSRRRLRTSFGRWSRSSCLCRALPPSLCSSTWDGTSAACREKNRRLGMSPTSRRESLPRRPSAPGPRAPAHSPP